MSGLVGRWVEHFTLRSAVSAARAEDPEARARRRTSLAHAQQKLAAADALRPLGQRGASLALVGEALVLLVESAEADSTRAALVSLGVSDADEVAARLVEYAARLPVLDAVFSGADEGAHQRLRAAAAQAMSAAAPRVSSARTLRSVALTRSLAALALVFVACIVAGISSLPRPRILVEPSAYHGPAYTASNARDSNPETAWLLPDDANGYLDLRLSPARAVQSVTLLNAHNAPFNDRATKTWAVELWRGPNKLAVRDGDWAFSPAPVPTVVPISADGVDRIRFVIKSHHQRGGGLAEISFR